MALIKAHFVSCEEISDLLKGMTREISTHDLSMWLKSKTDDQWVVMPRLFCAMTISFFEEKAEENSGKLSFYKDLLQELRELKNYL
jgi:hypothetical protein